MRLKVAYVGLSRGYLWRALIIAITAICAMSASRAALYTVTLTTNPASPCAVNTPVTLTAGSSASGSVEYYFKCSFNGEWVDLQPYSTSSTCVWTPREAGYYYLGVTARIMTKYGTSFSSRIISYRATTAPTPPSNQLSAVSLSIQPGLTVQAKTPITLTATPTGGTRVQYKFLAGYSSGGGTTWMTLRDYDSANTTTGSLTTARQYTIQVRAREEGSTTEFTDSKTLTITDGTPPPPPTGTGRIAFVSTRDGNYEIYSMNPDGTDQRRLTNNSAWEDELSYSPDGSKIIFISNRTGNFDIYTMNIDGSDVRQLTNTSRNEWGPTYSPDGQKIIFFATISGRDQICIMNADGTGEKRVTVTSSLDVLPMFTPDGQYVVYNSAENGQYDLCVMRPDGSEKRKLTTRPANDWYHDISPDGQTIAYTSGGELRLINLNGSNDRFLTTAQGYSDMRPTFSPDGQTVAFASNRGGQWDIYSMPLAGGSATRLTTSSAADNYPMWSPR